MSKTDQGNPEIGMSEDSIDAAAQEETQQVPTGSVDSFFEQLENQVNGGIQETKATQNQNSGPQEEVTRIQQDNGPTKETPIKTTKDIHNREKRYKDIRK